MKLEAQIEKLQDLGLPLAAGITIDDLLVYEAREAFEAAPFDVILFCYGREIEEEPSGRFFCDHAWDLDYECIENDGDYIAVVENFHRLSGRKKALSQLSDSLDIETGKATLQYELDGLQRQLKPRVNDDWLDPAIVDTIMKDLKEVGYDFFSKDNGQASVWFYLRHENAKTLNSLAENVFGLDKKPWWRLW